MVSLDNGKPLVKELLKKLEGASPEVIFNEYFDISNCSDVACQGSYFMELLIYAKEAVAELIVKDYVKRVINGDTSVILYGLNGLNDE